MSTPQGRGSTTAPSPGMPEVLTCGCAPSRMLATLHLSADGRIARVIAQEATDPARVLTTAKVLHGRILYVDSTFDGPVASGPYEVVTSPLAP